MGFIVVIFITFILIFLIQFYFIRKIYKSILRVFPGISAKILKRILRILLIFLNLYPIFLLAVYIFISPSGGESRPRVPESAAINYLLLYPFWLWTFLVVQCILFFLILEILKLLFLPIYRKHRENLKGIEAKIILAVLAFFIIYVPVRVVIDYNVVSTRIVEYSQS
ncbi:MAG TPA: hypothetical protein VI230_01240, partial [Ignavibacteriaceae bacterium]